MPVADIKGPDGSVVATLNIPDGASPETVQAMGQRAALAARARMAAVEAGHPEPDTYVRQIGAESAFQTDAVSPKGARGPAQFMPATARQYGVTPGGDPSDDLRGGAEYSRDMIQQFGGDVRLGLAAYNAGPGNVQKYGGVPPFPETQGYVDKVLTAGAAGAPAAERAPSTMPLMPVERRPDGLPVFPPPIITPDRKLTDQLGADSPDVQRRFSPEGWETFSRVAPAFMLPAAQGYAQAAAIGAAYNAVAEGVEQVRAGNDADYGRIGRAALIGGAVGAAAHGVSNAVFGRPVPERRAAEGTLGMRSTFSPVPVTEGGKRRFAAVVDEALDDALPPTSKAAVDQAYDQFTQVIGTRPLDVTQYNKTLAAYGPRFLKERMEPPRHLLTPVGREVAPGKWVASAEELAASERGIAFLKASKTQPLPLGLMKSLQGDLSKALKPALTDAERAIYATARDVAQANGQRVRALALLNSKTVKEGGATDIAGLASRLERYPERYTERLGPELFGELTTIANAGRALVTQPGGRELFAKALARVALIGAGAATGGYAGGEYGAPVGAGGAIAGAFLPGKLLTPGILTALEYLARNRATAGAVAEGAGRLAVALQLEQEPNERQAAPPPMPVLPTPTPRPLGQVGAP